MGFQVDAVVTIERIGLHVTAIVFQKRGRSGPLMSGRIVEHGQRVERIAHVGPESARMLQLSPCVSNFHRSVVGMHDVRAKHHPHGHGVKRLKELGRLEPPPVHRLPRDSHALPLENPFQAVQGKMVRALAHDDLRQKPRRCQTSGNRLRRLGSHHHVLLHQRQTAFRELLATNIFLADMNQDMHCRRPPIILFALLRRQFGQVLGATQRFLFGVRQIVDDFFTLNVLWNAAASVAVAVCSVRRRGLRRCRHCGLVLVSLGLQIKQQRLMWIKLLARAAVQTPQQEMHVVLLPLECSFGLLQLVEQLHDQYR